MSNPDIFKAACNLLKKNLISPSDPENRLNWRQRTGPWGRKIENLLLPPEAGDYITPNKNTFVGQWYWDTMGTNTGLLRSGDDLLKKTALSMVQNLFMLYDKTGLIPNAADSVQHTRSQPPFLSSMCLDIANLYFGTNSEERRNWYKIAYKYCKREVTSPWEKHATEYGFRWFDDTIKTYPGHSPEETLEYFRPESRSDFRILRSIVYRILDIDLEKEIEAKKPIESLMLKAFSKLSDEQRREICKWLYSRRLLVCSGMDFTASYGVRSLPSCLRNLLEPGMLSASDQVYSNIASVSPVDLNCMIFKYYSDLYFISGEIARYSKGSEEETYNKEQKHWEEKIDKLRDLIFSLHYDGKSGRFINYDMKRKKKMINEEHLTHHTYPLFAGLVDESHTGKIKDAIVSLTTNFGIKFTKEQTGYQWDFNMWPLQTWLTVIGLMNYNYLNEAKEIGSGYIRCAEKVFNEKGSFFEKYNPEDGSINTDGRYPSEPDFSWSAAIYVALKTVGLY